MGRTKRQKLPPMEALQSDYPSELIYEILLRLPSKSLLKFKCVCKSWKALISDPQFIRSHHTHSIASTERSRSKIFCWFAHSRVFSTLLYEDGEFHVERLHFPREKHAAFVLGYCHGFVLLKEKRENFCLWNPSIKRYTTLPCPFAFPRESRAGLCYDSISDDYKVVAVNCEKDCYVYSLRKGCWGEGIAFPYSQISCVLSLIGVFVDGALHWVLTCVRNRGVDRSEGNCYEHRIVCFDSEKEEFSVVPRPEVVADGNEFGLSVLGGRLALHCFDHSNTAVQIWLRTGRDFSDASCWGKSVVVPNVPVPLEGEYPISDVELLCYDRDCNILMYIDLCFGEGGFFLYDVKNEKLHKKRNALFGFLPGRRTTIAYVDSLLLPGVYDKPKRKWLKTEKRERHSTGTTKISDGSTSKS